jgi:hypothetical protein
LGTKNDAWPNSQIDLAIGAIGFEVMEVVMELVMEVVMDSPSLSLFSSCIGSPRETKHKRRVEIGNRSVGGVLVSESVSSLFQVLASTEQYTP